MCFLGKNQKAVASLWSFKRSKVSVNSTNLYNEGFSYRLAAHVGLSLTIFSCLWREYLSYYIPDNLMEFLSANSTICIRISVKYSTKQQSKWLIEIDCTKQSGKD